MNVKRFFLVISALLLSSCLSCSTKTQLADSELGARVVEGTYEDVFNATVSALSTQGFTFGYISKKKGIVQTNQKPCSVEQCQMHQVDLPVAPGSELRHLRQVRAEVKKLSNSKVEIDLNVMIWMVDTAKDKQLSRKSTGQLESNTFHLISEILEGRG